MLFNSIEFAVFLPIVFLLYWFVFRKNLKAQNFLIVVASYVFYGWWDYRFLALIIFSTLIDFSVGILLEQTTDKLKRRFFLWTSILVNLGFLGIFKYYNFFLENVNSAFNFFGYQFNTTTLKVILPVGISFYTFQTLSYTIDVYRKKLKPTKDIIAFSAFVCFFPQLVAGPIERATKLLPQFYIQRKFSYTHSTEGLRQILWGLFKKVVIADNCAVFANEIFDNSSNLEGSTLFLGALFFTFQIYGDFSGYSDIAIGTARLFGFDLMKNFAYPYFSRDIAEFWRRWHISLSTWFRDYLYIPLGGSRGGMTIKVRNTFIIFVVSGFWHGANWTFIAWGFLNAIYFLPLLLANKNRTYVNSVVAEGKYLPSYKEFTAMLITFLLTVLAWIFFRSENITHAFSYLNGIFNISILSVPELSNLYDALLTIAFVIILLTFEWLGREKDFAIERFGSNRSIQFRYAFYMLLVLFILWFGGKQQEFIYFQF